MPAHPANDTSNALAAEMTAALDWWREAGVDCLFEDSPRQWLVAPQPGAPDDPPAGYRPLQVSPPPAPPPPRPTIGGDPASWPQTLAAFAPWWLSEPALDQGQLRGRVCPRGPGEAALMVLVAQPEEEDGDVLLSSRQGTLLAAMLAAMGIAAPQVYVASALPRHTPMADWEDLAAQGLGEVLRHHVALVRPSRVIAFGRHVAALLGTAGLVLPRQPNRSTQTGSILPEISQDGASVPLLVARDLDALLERPIAKGAFWQNWLEWSGGE